MGANVGGASEGRGVGTAVGFDLRILTAKAAAQEVAP